MKILLKLPILMATALMVPAAAQAQISWTGPYGGIHGAYSFQRGDKDQTIVVDTDGDGVFNDVVVNSAGNNILAPGSCSGAALDTDPASGCRQDRDSSEIGVHAGYDWQLENGIVVGVLGGYSQTSITDSVSVFSTAPANYIMTRKLQGLAEMRARVGYTVLDTLAYATGGAAYGHIKNSFRSTNTANAFSEADDNGSWGYTMGGGLEHRVNQKLSVGLQYLYRELESDDYVVRVGPGTTAADDPFRLSNPNGTDMMRSKGDFESHAFEILFNYHF